MSNEIKGLVNKTNGIGLPDAKLLFVEKANPEILDNLQANNKGIYNLTDPRSGQPKDGANKNYVDNKVGEVNDTIDLIRTELLDDIASEASSRTAGDLNLQTQLTQETSSRTAADTNLQDQIDDEITNRGLADNNLQSQIDTELDTRENEDIILQNQIDDLYNQVSSSTGDLEFQLNQEILNRVIGDSDLEDQLGILTDEFQSSTSWLNNKINELSSSTDQNIGLEVSSRTAGDSNLQDQINNLSTSTSDSLLSEETERISSDTAIEFALSQEINERGLQDSILEDNLNNLTDNYLSSTSNIYSILTKKADLDNNNEVVLSQLPPEAREMRYSSNITSRDNILEKFIGLTVLVEDASDDPLVGSGSAIYFCYQSVPTEEWRLITALESTGNLQEQINELSSSTSQEDSNLWDAINQEITNRENADNSLQNLIDEMDIDLSSTTVVIQDHEIRIDDLSSTTSILLLNESSSRTAADELLQNNIDLLSSSTNESLIDEEFSRIYNDILLQDQIDELSSSTEMDILNEISSRTAADELLQNNIDSLSSSTNESLLSEASSRTAVDDSLDLRIDYLENMIGITSSSTGGTIVEEVAQLRIDLDNEILDREECCSSGSVILNDHESRITYLEDGGNLGEISSSVVQLQDDLYSLNQEFMSSTSDIYDTIANLKFNDLTDVIPYSSTSSIQLVKVNNDGNGLDYINSFDLSTYTVTPQKLVEQKFIAVDNQTSFNLDYMPSSIESVEFFIGPDRQHEGIIKDYTVNLDTGNVTWLDRNYILQAGDEILIRYLRGVEASHTELNGIVRSIQEPLIGTKNGINTVFTLSKTPVSDASVVIFLNPSYQAQGVGKDYTISGTIVTFVVAPQNTDELNAMYDVFNIASEKVQEIPSGVIDGVNREFVLTDLPINYGGVTIYLNGAYQSQGSGVEYVIIGKTITFENAPGSGSKIHVVYERNTSDLVVGRVQGEFIDNIGDSHIALQELIDQREYEENLNVSVSGYSNSTTLYPDSVIQFSTRKRVIPNIILSTNSSVNLNNTVATNVTVNGFNLAVIPSSAPAWITWNGTWQAQCASYTKFIEFTDTHFTLIIGIPLKDEDGDPTGYYSTQEYNIAYSNISVSSDGKSYIIEIPGTTIIVPLSNEEQIIKFLYGLESSHLSAQTLILMKYKMGEEMYNSFQQNLRNKSVNKKELKKIYNEKVIEWQKLDLSKLTLEQKFLIENDSLVNSRIYNGNLIVTESDLL